MRVGADSGQVVRRHCNGIACRKKDPPDPRAVISPRLIKVPLDVFHLSHSEGRSLNDEKRREYFLEKLREKLKAPEFRKIEGFPLGNDEDILAMSDLPYYTACPNPFIPDFIREYGKPYDPQSEYNRKPFAVDVSEGKTDPICRAHSYHTKVPHLAIVPSILHYTETGDMVPDGFCGSGMTGVAAQWCGSAPEEYRREIEDRFEKQGQPKPRWGTRRAVLNDLFPAATFIAANYNLGSLWDKKSKKTNSLSSDFIPKHGKGRRKTGTRISK